MVQGVGKKVVARDRELDQGATPKLSTTQAKREASQETLLQDVKKEVQERRKQSLHNAVRLTLEIEQQDYRVLPPWSAAIAQRSQPAVPLDAGTQIVEVFNRPELSRKLLVLGEPGSGKTTMMLELAQDLLQRTTADKAEPIPILISLSSWKKPEQSIFEWLVGELQRKYGVRQDFAQRWLEKKQLLPLLDGLDEVAPQHQKACALALNDWLIGELDQRPCGVLICCRREALDQVVEQPLSLYGAIYLQALTVKQIEDYLAQNGLQDVWQTVQQDEALQELLTTPLFLSMFGLVQKQGKFSFSDWRSLLTSDLKIEYLLDTYWKAVISRELVIDPSEKRLGILSKTYGTKPLPSHEAVKRALVFVAKALRQETQTELLIERMQPSWLPEEEQRWNYRILFAMFLLIFPMASLWTSSLLPTELALLLFTAPWLRYLLTMDYIEPAERLQFNEISSLVREHSSIIRIVLSLTATSFTGFALLTSRIGTGWSNVLYYILVVPLTGLTINMSVIWLFANIRAEITTQVEANQGIKDSWRNIPFFVLFVLLLTGLLCLRFRLGTGIVMGTDFSSQAFFSYAIYITGFASFEGGGKALIQHFVLRLVLAWNRYAPLRYDLLLNYCAERLLLQRVGGRYRFMHKLLQDHFAKMDLG